MLNAIIVLFSFSVFALMEGQREAYFYHYAEGKNIRNLHNHFFAFRVLIATIFVLAINTSPIDHIVKVIAMGLIFPFLHDGMYYLQRNVLNPGVYLFRWKDYKDGNAVMDFTYIQRLIMYIIGMIAYFIFDLC